MVDDEARATALYRFIDSVAAVIRETAFPGLQDLEPETRLSVVGVRRGVDAVRLRTALNRQLGSRLPEGSVFMMMSVAELCELLTQHTPGEGAQVFG